MKRTIQAIIVSNEKPPRVVMQSNGQLPETIFVPETHGTIEGTLHAIGRRVLGNTVHVSVDQCMYHNGTTVYQTKPIDNPCEPIESDYSWVPFHPIDTSQ